MPSTCGIRMSISTTSGRCCRTAASAWAPSSASPTTSMSVGRGQDQPQPGAHQRVVVDQQHPHVAHVSSASTTKSPDPSGPCTRVPPASATRSRSPSRPAPEPGSVGRRVRRHRLAVADADVQAVAGGAGDPHRGRRCPAACLPTLVERLLHDPVGVAPQRAGHVVGMRRAHLEVDLRAGAAGSPRPAAGCRAASAAGWPAPGRARRPRAARRSRRAAPRGPGAPWRAAGRPSPAPAAGGRSGRTSRPPACSAISEIRWASTSCISRAIRVRSATRACSSWSSWSASARRARSRSESSSCRRARTYIPQPLAASASGIDQCQHGDRTGGRAVDGEGEHRGDPQQGDQHGGRAGRCTASDDNARRPAGVAEVETTPSRRHASATPTGHRRRPHRARQASAPAVTSTATCVVESGSGLSCSSGLRNNAPGRRRAARRGRRPLVRVRRGCGSGPAGASRRTPPPAPPARPTTCARGTRPHGSAGRSAVDIDEGRVPSRRKVAPGRRSGRRSALSA